MLIQFLIFITFLEGEYLREKMLDSAQLLRVTKTRPVVHGVTIASMV